MLTSSSLHCLSVASTHCSQNSEVTKNKWCPLHGRVHSAPSFSIPSLFSTLTTCSSFFHPSKALALYAPAIPNCPLPSLPLSLSLTIPGPFVLFCFTADLVQFSILLRAKHFVWIRERDTEGPKDHGLTP